MKVNDIVTSEEPVQRGEKTVHGGIEMLRPNRRHMMETYPLILCRAGLGVPASHVDLDVVTSFYEPCGERFYMSLDAAETGRNPFLADKSDPHEELRPRWARSLPEAA